MTLSRYNKRKTKRNEEDMYRKHFEDRDVEYINHYTSPEFIKNSDYKLSELGIIYHTWRLGDRSYKLAEKHYGDPSLWWVICQFNQKPTENLFKEGDTVLIPLELEKVLGFLGV